MHHERLNKLREQAEQALRNGGNSIDVTEVAVYQAELEAQLEQLIDTEQRLVEQRNQLQRLLEISPIGFVAFDEKYHVSIINQTALTLLDTTPAFVNQSKAYSLIREPLQKDLFTQWILKNQTKPLELHLTQPVERYIKIERNAFTGQQSLITISDITSYRYGELALKEGNLAAKRANATKDKLLSTVSHEIRTPLNSILGTLQIMQQRFNNDPDARVILANATNSVDDLTRMLNEMLYFSEINRAEISLKKDSFKVDELVEYVVMQRRSYARKKQVHVYLDNSTPPSTTYRGDTDKINEVVDTVIENAISYHGTNEVQVAIRAQYSYDDTDNVDILFRLVTEQQDGLGPAHQSKTPLVTTSQVTEDDEELSRIYSGEGLKLSIAKALCELMGGNLTIQRDNDGYPNLRIRLPLEQADPHRSISDAEDEYSNNLKVPTLHDKLIYLVDDNEINLVILESMLRDTGAKIVKFTDAYTLVEQCREVCPDVILADIIMPGMDGREMTRKLRHLGFNMPIIAVSGNVQTHERRSYIDAGVDGIIEKPVLMRELFHKLKNIVASPYSPISKG